jgi:hypothetical protein
VWGTILSFYGNVRSCDEVSSTGIEVSQPADEEGVWQEAWTLIACGDTVVLKIKFTPASAGGVHYDITE